MPAYLFIIAAFVLPFLIFLLLPLWGNRRADGTVILMIIALFLWCVGIGATLVYLFAHYALDYTGLNFPVCYGLSVAAGVMLLAGRACYRSGKRS